MLSWLIRELHAQYYVLCTDYVLCTQHCVLSTSIPHLSTAAPWKAKQIVAVRASRFAVPSGNGRFKIERFQNPSVFELIAK